MRFILSFLLILAVTPALSQTDAERAAQAVQNIGELLENRAVLREELSTLEAAAETAEALPTGEARKTRLNELTTRIQEIKQLLQDGGDSEALKT